MGRNFRTEAVILRNNRFGEIHKGVTLLSPDYGLLSAVAYGAYSAKGKLRSITNPLCTGTAFLYRDPVKDSLKITDMDCREFFEGIRGSLVKFFTASVWMEVVLKTFGGDADEVFPLLTGCLRLLDAGRDEAATRLMVQFLWRYLMLSGAAPDTQGCAGCGRPREASLVFTRGGHGFFCPACASSPGDAAVSLSAGALGYLSYSTRVPLEKAAEASLDAASLAAVKTALFFLAEELAGGPLNSIRTGAGVL